MKHPSIILVTPQMGANIGAAARVMFNFGLTDLRLVAPRDGWPNAEAQANSAGALEVMPEVSVFDTLAEALADLHFVLATTARPRDMVKPVHDPQGAASAMRERSAGGQGCGFVFGAERAGLVNDDIALCQGIINIPTNPDFSSLNLAQAVLLCAWEWFRGFNPSSLPAGERAGVRGQGTNEHPHPIPPPSGGRDMKEFPAPHAELQNFFGRLEGALEEADFFKAPDLKPTMLRNIRSMFTRSDLTEQELRTLHGMLSALIRQQKTP